MQIKINIPDNLFNSSIEQKIKLFAALMMFKTKKLSLDDAVALSGIDKSTFMKECVHYDIPIYEYSETDKTFTAKETTVLYKSSAFKRSNIQEEIKNQIARNPHVKRAWLFGSFARNENKAESDIDIMIEVDKNSKFSLFDLAAIKHQLEEKIPFRIDLVMKDAVRTKIMERIMQDLILIYEK